MWQMAKVGTVPCRKGEFVRITPHCTVVCAYIDCTCRWCVIERCWKSFVQRKRTKSDKQTDWRSSSQTDRQTETYSFNVAGCRELLLLLLLQL